MYVKEDSIPDQGHTDLCMSLQLHFLVKKEVKDKLSHPTKQYQTYDSQNTGLSNNFFKKHTRKPLTLQINKDVQFIASAESITLINPKTAPPEHIDGDVSNKQHNKQDTNNTREEVYYLQFHQKRIR